MKVTVACAAQHARLPLHLEARNKKNGDARNDSGSE